MNHDLQTLPNIAPCGNMICSVMLCDCGGMAELDTPGSRLRWAREQAGYVDAAAFAKAAQVNATTYRAYENDQNGYARHAPAFAARLHVPTDWLLRGGERPDVPYSANRMISTEVVPTGIPDPANSRPELPRIPVVGSAMGIGSFDPEQHVELTELDMAEVLDWVVRPESVAADKRAYAVTIVGDSMWPRFRPGRRVIVSPRAPVAIGDDVIVQLRGGADGGAEYQDRVTTVLIKELARRSATYIELRQFNPDVTFKVSADQVAAVHKVIGEIY